MQVTTVSDAATCPKTSGQAAGGQSDTGGFDLVMAALGSSLAPPPVGVEQGLANSGGKNRNGNLKLADQPVLFGDPKLAEAEKELADKGVGGSAGENAVQSLTGVTNITDLINNQASLQNPAMILSPVQCPQIAVQPSTGDESTIQQSTGAGSGAVPAQTPVVAGNPASKGSVIDAVTQLTGDASTIQQSTGLDSGVVSTQCPVVAANPASQGSAVDVPIQPQPGATPSQVLSEDSLKEVKPVPATAQKGVQQTPEMALLNQGQLTIASQAQTSNNKQRTTLVTDVTDVTDERTQGKEAEQSGSMKAKALGSVAANEKPVLKDALQADKPSIALSLSQTTTPSTQSDGKQAQRSAGEAGAVLTLSETKTVVAGEKTKQFTNPQSNATQHNTAQLSTATQVGPAQFDQFLTAQTAGAAAKGVGLPDLKESILQEIKHMVANYKGEPQTQVQLKLEPENLGQLTIKLYFNKGELNAHFYTGNSFVKDALEGSLQQLRETLGQQDLRLNEALVFTGTGAGSGGGNSFGERYYGREAPVYGGTNHRTYDDAPAKPLNFIPTGAEASGVNYLI